MQHSNFLKVRCPRCRNQQVTYGKASTWVKCRSCNKLLIKPTGGKAKVKARVKSIV